MNHNCNNNRNNNTNDGIPTATATTGLQYATGEKIVFQSNQKNNNQYNNNKIISIIRKIGEGGFSFVYLVKEEESSSSISTSPEIITSKKRLVSNVIISSPTNKLMKSINQNTNNNNNEENSKNNDNIKNKMVLKVTAIRSREQRDIALKEVNILQRLSHPSIARMIDHSLVMNNNSNNNGNTRIPTHFILLEYCNGGSLLQVMKDMELKKDRFTLENLIVQFGQICNAVSYLHAQRIPNKIIHRDLKPENFVFSGGNKSGYLKLCDFGSVVIGDVMLRDAKERADAEDVIIQTTTPMFRAPEMVDLFMKDRLTEGTDIWALGCCLYFMSYFQHCFDGQNSTLAILNKNVVIPNDHDCPLYGGTGLTELIHRMLTVNVDYRVDIAQVILCLSALYSGKPLPTHENAPPDGVQDDKTNLEGKVGSYRTDGQGISGVEEVMTPMNMEGKKLNPNSVAARRKGQRRSRHNADDTIQPYIPKTPTTNPPPPSSQINENCFESCFPTMEDDSFSTANNPFQQPPQQTNSSNYNNNNLDTHKTDSHDQPQQQQHEEINLFHFDHALDISSLHDDTSCCYSPTTNTAFAGTWVIQKEDDHINNAIDEKDISTTTSFPFDLFSNTAIDDNIESHNLDYLFNPVNSSTIFQDDDDDDSGEEQDENAIHSLLKENYRLVDKKKIAVDYSRRSSSSEDEEEGSNHDVDESASDSNDFCQHSNPSFHSASSCDLEDDSSSNNNVTCEIEEEIPNALQLLILEEESFCDIGSC